MCTFRKVLLTFAALATTATAATTPPTAPKGKTFDELKWERLAKRRELRIATERRYEACVRQCEKSCGSTR